MENPGPRTMSRARCSRRGLWTLFGIVCVWLGTGAASAAPFYLSTERIYAPGEQPQIRIESQGLDWLDVRLYRLEDPADYLLSLPQLRRPDTWGHVKSYDVLGLLDAIKFRSYQQLQRLGREWLTTAVRRDARDSYGPLMNELASVEPPHDGPHMLPLRTYPLLRSWREALPNGSSSWRWSQSSVDVPAAELGAYLVEAIRGGDVGATVVIVSRLGVLTKKSPDELLVFCVDRVTGLAQAGVRLRVLHEGKVLAEGLTDAHGLWRHRTSAVGKLIVLADRGTDFAISDPAYYPASRESAKLYLYTERPLYRPGHTVQFKGVVRSFDAAGFHLPAAAAEVPISVYAPDGQELVTVGPVPLGALGSFHGSLSLPSELELGKYTLAATWAGSEFQTEFHVEEYHVPTYTAAVRPESDAVLAGEPLRARVSVAYFYGDALPEAPVSWYVYRSRYYPRYDEDDPLQFFFADATYQNRASELVTSGEGRLDAEGHLSIVVPTEALDAEAQASAKGTLAYTYRIKAVVRDPEGYSIEANGRVRVTASPFALVAETQRFVYRPGETVSLRLRSRDFGGQPLASSVELEVLREGEGGEEDQTLFARSIEIGPSGEAVETFVADTQGALRLSAVARLPDGVAESRTRLHLLVTTGEQTATTLTAGGVDVVLDRASYRPGETARALVVTPAQGASVLLTIEGERLHMAQVLELEGNSALIELPLEEAYTPNVTVSAALLIGDRLFQRERPLLMPARHRVLAVEVHPNKQNYSPREAGSVSVRVTDEHGKPVAGAEVCLGIVDEAIYALQPELVVAPQQFYYHRRRNNVRTASSTGFRFYGYAREVWLDLAEAALGRDAGFAELKLADVGGREIFEATAGFFPALVTDRDGVARATFRMPENLTRWRFTARAFTADTRVGEGLGSAVTRKPLVVSMGLPRRLTERDQMQLPVIVHNHEALPQQVRTKLDVDGPARGQAPRHERAAVMPLGTRRFDYGLEVDEPGTLRLGASVTAPGASDALLQEVPVAEHSVPTTERRSVLLGADRREAELLFDVTNLDRALVELAALGEVSQAIDDALHYLIGFPYGCVEQTMSRFVPDVVALGALEKAGIARPELEARLEELVSEGLRRLYSLQHEDGGWGWWAEDQTDAFMTAYVLWGLQLTEKAGYEVSADVRYQGQQRLRELIDSDALDAGQRSFALASAAGWGRFFPDLAERLFERRAELSVQARAWLAQALALTWRDFEKNAAKSEHARTLRRKWETLLAELEAAAQSEPGDVSATGPVYWGGAAETLAEEPVETTAIVLMALRQGLPHSPLLGRGIVWLLMQRAHGSWPTTRQTAFAVMALAEAVGPIDELTPATVRFFVGGAELARVDLRPGEAPAGVRLEAEHLRPGQNRVHVDFSGPGSVVVVGTLTQHDLSEDLPAQDAGIAVRRSIGLLVQGHVGERQGFEVLPLSTFVEPGERLLSRVEIRSDVPRDYLIVEDPTPGGSVALRSLADFPIAGLEPWAQSIRRELRDGRVVFFVPHLAAHETLVLYSVLEVVLEGTFHTLPASAQEMYYPSHRGRSAETILWVARRCGGEEGS
jgi:alpha-2-macroglobulin